MEVSNHIISYAQLRDGYKPENDKYGIASYEFEARKKTFLANPNLSDYDKTYQYLVLADGIPVGRDSYYPTLMKFDKEFHTVLSGSSFEVFPDYRKYALGLDLLMYYNSGIGYKQLLGGGLSIMAVPLHKKLKFTMFPIPTYLLRRNIGIFLHRFGLNGLLLKVFSKLLNPIFNIKEFLFCNTRKLNETFTVKKLQKVPEWVDDIVLNDGHKYMEVHNYEWLQWNLDNCFDDDERNCQEFYAIYKTDTPVGFFMTKIRVTDKQNNVLSGTVVEWGSKDEEVLSELNINKLALKSFSKEISYISIGTLNFAITRQLNKCGFFRIGDTYIIFKDKEKKYTDAKDSNLWRLRLGYCDTILS
jgi:hypothetical protein